MSEIKRIRFDQNYSTSIEDLENKFENRLSEMEKKMDLLVSTCTTILNNFEKLMSRETCQHDCCASLLLPKILFIDDYLRNLHKSFETDIGNDSDGNCNPVLLVPSGKLNSDDTLDSNVHILTLNSEDDIPEGSWLGDTTNPKARVRVDIPPSLLMHINTHCLTPEKMALTLLDCLFSREILAVSNLSGKGKHSKKQLDPLLIYAIRCHLMYKFNITDKDWHRIKQNIDSKCRAAWRKKISGVPLGAGIYKGHQSLSEPLSEESSDGISNLRSSPIRILRHSSNRNKTLISMDKQSVKVFSDDVLKEILPAGELFSVVDSECFTLSDQALVSEECNSPAEEIILGTSPVGAMDDD